MDPPEPSNGSGPDNSAPMSAKEKTTLERTNGILDKIRGYDHYSLGDFLLTAFSSDSHKKLSKPSQQVITQWLAGNSRSGTRPAEIVDAMYRNPSSYTHVDRQVQTAEFLNLSVPETASTSRSAGATSFLPDISTVPADRKGQKQLFNARQGLEEWAARLVLWFVNREASTLEKALAPASAPTWSTIKRFSLSQERPIMKSKAPVLWTVLRIVALNKRRLARQSSSGAVGSSESSSSSSSDGSPTGTGKGKRVRKATEESELAATIAIYMLIGFRNKMSGFLRSFTGVSLFASNVQKSIFRYLGRMRLSRSYSSVLKYLTKLAHSAKDELKSIGRRAFDSLSEDCTDPEFFYFNFDNVNKYVVPRNETIANKSMIRNGTAATAIIMEDVPVGAFAREPYMQNVEAGRRRELTVTELFNDIDSRHRANIGGAAVMRILTTNIPTLAPLRSAVEKLYQEGGECAQHRLRLRQSRIHPMGTSGINEATTDGVSAVLDDLVQQTGMEPSWFDNLLIPVGGDQLSIDRIRKAICYLDQEETVYYSKSWAVPIIQPWHMGWAYLKALVKTHWWESTGKDTLGFRRAVGVLGRNLNADNGEYYPTENAVVTVFDTMVLCASRFVLRRQHGRIERSDGVSKSPQLLEELELYFAQDGPLRNPTIEQLQALGRVVYNEYLTTKAYHAALSDPILPSQPTATEIEQTLIQSIQQQLLISSNDSGVPPASSSRRKSVRATHLDNSASILVGDHALANAKLFMRDTLEFVEFTSAMEDGDTGRLFKVMDTLRFAFWGCNSKNYGAELLEIACNFKYEYPEALRIALMNNYLVNPSGLPKRWQAGDLLQEHYNKDIKTIFNLKNSDFDDKFMRESISLNIAGFSFIKDQMMDILGLGRAGKRHAVAKRHHDINVLGAHFEEEHLFDFEPGRSQPYTVSDMIATGYSRLSEGALQGFLDRTLRDPAAVQDDLEDDAIGPVQDPAPVSQNAGGVWTCI